jgi:thymidylate synthase ThyX
MADYIFQAYDGDPGIAVEEFTDEESRLLEPHVTNTNSNVFAWKVSDGMSLEQTGALLSRYSRTSLTGRRLFLKEFYPNKSRGREFFDAWLVDFGDDSIQEMVGGLPSACEFVSNVAVKEIEDCRLGSYIEKSTRYVAFDKRLPNNEFMFYKDPDILNSRYGDNYLELMRSLFASYSGNIEKMSNYIKQRNPLENISFKINDRLIKIGELSKELEEQSGITEADLVKAYDNSIKANALDFLRDYLPMSVLTHVGISMDGRSYENLLNKMLASPLSEARFIGKRLNVELGKIVPSLIKRIGETHGQAFQRFIGERNSKSLEFTKRLASGMVDKGESVELIEYKGQNSPDPDKSLQVAILSAILYRFSNGASLSQLIKKVEDMSSDERKRLIAEYVGARANRRHKPGRAFENAEYLFDLKGRIGIYRDIQRHRIGTQERQNFGTELGYDTRKEFDEIGIVDDYRSKMAEVDDLYKKLKEEMPYQAQYVVTFGFNIRWYYRMNARQLYHLCELRSSQQGHPDYRKLVQLMAMKVKAVHPTIIEHMKYLDMSDKTLGRLDSEVRIAVKKGELQKSSKN